MSRAGEEPVRRAMSSAERRLYLQSLTPSGDQAYHLLHLARLVGPLGSLEAVRSFAQGLLHRHDALRTSYRLQGVEFSALVWPNLVFDWEVIDGAEEDLPGLVARLDRPFELSRPPLWRVALLRLSAQEAILVVVCHHLVFDGFSGGVVAQEIREVLEGREPTSEGPSYSDFVAWEEAFFDSSEYRRQRDFWLAKVPQPPQRCALRPDFPPPATRCFAGRSLFFSLPGDPLRAFARDHEVTPFNVLMAAFLATLARLTGQREVTLGTLISPRERGGFHRVLGLFANSLPLTWRVDGECSLADLAAAVRATMREAMQHADYPFEHLVAALPFREPGARNPLFDVVFNFERSTEARRERLGGVEVEMLDYQSGLSMFDLSVDLIFFRDSVRCKVDYATSLYRRETIEGVMETFRALLSQGMAQPARALSELALMEEPAQKRLEGWNQTDRPWSREQTFFDRWEQQRELVADYPALRWEGTEWTYHQLEQRAIALAYGLRAQGVEPGQVVAVALSRCPDAVAVLLAVWKVGAIYTPIDPEHPVARRLDLLQRSEAVCLVLAASHDHRETALGSVPTVTTERLADASPTPGAWPKLAADQVAYLLFTSGSTGRPRGVEVEHRAVMAHLEAVRSVYRLRSEDNVLQFASSTFDASLEQVLVTLLVGACLILPPPLAEPEAMLQLLSREQVTVAEFPPAYLQLLAQHQPPPRWRGLRLLLCGGDVLPLPLAEAVLGQLPRSAQLVNIYGPTEATMACTAALLEPGSLSQASSVPIGRPLPNTRVYLLDERGQPLPPGLVGELAVAGDRLARGYLADPVTTAERFVWLETPRGRERVYRTGDRARWLEDGQLEFLGRGDRQVQLRGHRLELGEIEAVLRQCPGVVDAAVTKVEQPLEGLLALLAGEPSQLREEEVVAWLRERLPAIMVPSGIRILPRLPRSPDGKLTQDAFLRAAGSWEGQRTDAGAPPSDPLELRLATIWQRLLGRDEIGREDDFYALGGHSLSALELLVAVRDQLGVERPLSDFLAPLTLKELASRVRRHQGREPGWTLPLAGSPAQPRLLMLPGLGGLPLDLQELAQELSSQWHCWAVALPEQEAAEGGLAALAERLRRELASLSPSEVVLLGHSFGAALAWELAEQWQEAGCAPRALVLLDAVAPGSQQELSTAELLARTVALLGEGCAWDETIAWEQPYAVAQAWSALQRQGRWPASSPLSDFERFLAVMAARAERSQEYRPQGRWAGPTLLVRAQGSEEGLASSEQDWGWSRWSSSSVAVDWSPGDHQTMLRAPYVQELSERVTRWWSEREGAKETTGFGGA